MSEIDDQANPDSPDGPGGGGQSDTPPTDAPVVESLTIDGVAYTPDQVKAFLKDSTDYKRLVPEYTRQQQILRDPNRFKEFGATTYPDLFRPAAPAAPTDPD